MNARVGSAEAISRAIKILSDMASQQLKVLMETKHLYQRVSFDPRAQLALLSKEIVFSEDAVRFGTYVKEQLPFLSLTPSVERVSAVWRGGGEFETVNVPMVLVENVKIFCSSCEEREAFAPAFVRDIDNEIANAAVRWGTPAPVSKSDAESVEQRFVVAYLCQRCNSELVTTLVTRRGWYLVLEGRSPFEGVKTPQYIPKRERHLFWEATVARNTGRVLAALFFLRSFAEQFARRQTGQMDVRVSGDDLMDAYSKTLCDQHRDVLPSLKVWYSKLSEAIHAARPDEALLEEAMRDIDRHFKIRDAFDIPEVAQPSSNSRN